MSGEARPSKKERREQRRTEDRTRQQEEARRTATRRLVTWGVVAAIAVVLVALAAGPLSALIAGGSAGAQGTSYADQGRDHINRGDSHAPYNSNPPTSGPHFGDWARWGIHEQELPDEQLVHNLEHGGVVIQYNCPSGCPEVVGQLKDLVGSYRSKVLLAPRVNAGVANRITLTAWGWLDGFDDFDAVRIRAFVSAHKDRGPELVPD